MQSEHSLVFRKLSFPGRKFSKMVVSSKKSDLSVGFFVS